MTRILSYPVVEKRILDICAKKADSKIFAACLYGPRVLNDSQRESETNALVVTRNYRKKISSHANPESDPNLFLLVIDKEMFESDVKEGRLGDLISNFLFQPYLPWINPRYFRTMEVKMKKRSATELIKTLIFQYPELSDLLLIKPEYFMYETMRRKVKLFPPLIRDFAETFTSKVRKQNVTFIMSGYLEALRELQIENCITFSNGYVGILKDFARATIQERNLVSNMFASINRTLLPYIQSLSLRIRTGYVQNQKTHAKRSRKAEKDLLEELKETEKQVLMPSPLGPIPISEETTIQDFIKKTVPGADELDLRIKEMGGALNSVFMLRIRKDNEMQKIVVKRFENWQGLKWFPLALWALGTQSFVVSGRKRLEREYSSNEFLRNQGFSVPKILYVSIRERLIFEEFVEGEKLTKIIKRIVTSKESTARDRRILRQIGKAIARAHSLGVTLGDCKPENILVKDDDDVCFLDLEQSTRNGNHPWDIAEFLYYSGHYIPPIGSDQAAVQIATTFLDGYIEGEGKREVVREAASAKYTKIFSVFTLPHIILLIAGICRRVGKEDGLHR